MASGQTVKLPILNKDIIEIKKRIQLSEGQRKALFEEIETERKRNQDEILVLKKRISLMTVNLQERKGSALKSRFPVAQLGPVLKNAGDKTAEEIAGILDLQRIDKTKKLDLIKYRLSQKQKLLSKLGKEYQDLVKSKSKKVLSANIEKPLDKAICELQNKINAVEVQWNEAEHVSVKYKEIERSLQDDAARFESKILKLEDELKAQQMEINNLQKMNLEASKLRTLARNALIQEEKNVVEAGSLRERQATEGRRLLEERRHDLEQLEKRFYHGKPQIRTDPDEECPKETETPESMDQDPIDYYKEIFEVLKDVTGGSTIDEVLDKFRAQKETQEQLASLRRCSEEEKKRLEQVQDSYVVELEHWKFVESKDIQRNSSEVDNVLEDIEDEKRKLQEMDSTMEQLDESTKTITQKLLSIYQNFKPGVVEASAMIMLEFLQTIFEEDFKERTDGIQVEDLELPTDKWLPSPYNGIMRRTPLPQLGSPTPVPPPGSDEEEEVPSRGFLKRQAQLVVDAKTKRKNMRFPLPKVR
ncbi:PREDICTED: coiled-coil domain-containing protein 151 [Nicrophorus vespilloides]|uniref:Coiled-coil domain-containing protein 151 n=1 Tax=Nicrophorus vespilloides TaxID=110193 RepID=A0ABM1N6H8_NICVS|nr:PREDICTED: coiled-coil domain-containing protein 151 [Nicrophorus vespilloides]